MPIPKTGALPLGDAPAGVSHARESGAYTREDGGWKGLWALGDTRYNGMMSEASIQNFHAHIYYDADEVGRAKRLAAAAQARFPIAVGHFHLGPVGPHPRGSCQLTVPTEQFGDFAQWIALNRDGLTIFAHTTTGEDRADHTEHVIWFGPSEPLDLSIFD
jgi:aromatic ring-cleaving dioxygenase